ARRRAGLDPAPAVVPEQLRSRRKVALVLEVKERGFRKAASGNNVDAAVQVIVEEGDAEPFRQMAGGFILVRVCGQREAGVPEDPEALRGLAWPREGERAGPDKPGSGALAPLADPGDPLAER